MKKRWSIVLCMVMILCSMSACGKSDANATTADGNVSQESQAAGSIAVGSQGSGATLTVGISGTPDLDPAIATSTSSLIAMVNLYDTLVYPTADGVEPRVAEKWEISEDGLTYTFHLKKGILFHDGSELQASDVAFSMNRLLAIGEGMAYLFTDSVDKAEAADDYTVVFHLKQPFGPFLDSLVRLYIVNEEVVMANKTDGVYGEFGDYGRAYMVSHDAGSGAYQAVELVQQDYFLAEKYDNWFMGWSNTQAPESFKLVEITEAATVRTMVSSGELDITDQWQSTETLTALSKVDGVKIGEFSAYKMYNLYYNTQLAPMDDPNFRKAMSCLVDYDTICKSIFVNSVRASSPVVSSVQGASESFQYSYSLDQAKEYLAASKYADTYQDYTVEILCNSDVADLEKIALMIQSAASGIGLNIEISKAPWVSIVDRVGHKDTTPHMLMICSNPMYNDAGCYLESRYHTKNIGTWEQGEWLDSKELDQMIEDAMRMVEPEKRYQAYGAIQDKIVKDLCPTAYLCEFTERIAYQTNAVKWPAMENTAGGEIPNALDGYMYVFADMAFTK